MPFRKARNPELAPNSISISTGVSIMLVYSPLTLKFDAGIEDLLRVKIIDCDLSGEISKPRLLKKSTILSKVDWTDSMVSFKFLEDEYITMLSTYCNKNEYSCKHLLIFNTATGSKLIPVECLYAFKKDKTTCHPS